MLLELLRHPQATIRTLVQDESAGWGWSLTGYFLVSFAQGYERSVTEYPDWPTIALLLMTAAGALILGVWAWAGLFGGVLHASARLLRGQEGTPKTIRAVGYALLWPGILAAPASAAVVSLGYRGGDLPPAASGPTLVQLGAGLWAVYLVVAALRARHGFGWGRAVVAYILPFVGLAIVAGVLLLAR